MKTFKDYITEVGLQKAKRLQKVFNKKDAAGTMTHRDEVTSRGADAARWKNLKKISV